MNIQKTVRSALLAACIALAVSVPDKTAAQISGYEILKSDVSARAAGMSGAFVGMTGDIYTLFYNPAGLINIDGRELSFSYVNHVLDVNAGNAVFSSRLRDGTRYAAGVNYINYGSFEGRDITGQPTGSFDAQDIVFTGGMARAYTPRFFYGISGKILYSTIADFSSTVLAADGGVIYTFPEYDLNLGVSIVNLGYVARAYANSKDDVPTVVKAGFTKHLAYLPLLISVEYRQFFDGDVQFAGGGEITITDSFKGRLGYNSYGPDQKIGDEGGAFAGSSFGFGFGWQRYRIDYSFSSLGVIGNLQRLTVSWNLKRE